MLAPQPHRSRIRPPWQFPLFATVQQNETYCLTHRRFDCEDVLMVHTQMSVIREILGLPQLARLRGLPMSAVG